jgi:uncharacterized protein
MSLPPRDSPEREEGPDWSPAWPERAAAEPAFEREQLSCWRCGKQVEPVDGRCPVCRARLATSLLERIVLPDDNRRSSIAKVIWLLVALMSVSVVGLRIAQARQNQFRPDADWQAWQLRYILIAGLIDAAIVVFGLFWIGRLTPTGPPPERMSRLLAWVWALPVLALLIGLNIGYHTLLRRYFNMPLLRDELTLSPEVVLTVCLMPAVFEELFFRHLALGSLREHIGVHGSVWISSVMFGMAHIGATAVAMLSIPILILLGVCFGYARVVSGGLLLPMTLHFVHNAVITYVNTLL